MHHRARGQAPLKCFELEVGTTLRGRPARRRRPEEPPKDERTRRAARARYTTTVARAAIRGTSGGGAAARNAGSNSGTATGTATGGSDDDEAVRRTVGHEVEIAHVPRPLEGVSLLRVGQVFTGTQTVTNNGKGCDEWRVNVEVQGADLARGTLCGSMEALDVPRADSPVLTFWRGQIIDNVNHFFRTDNWSAKFANDMEHWQEFRAFEALSADVRSERGDDIDLSQRRHIFMRWKEIFFVSPENECNLTIAGFYYCCMDRITGSIAGYYFDPSNQPWQKLLLRAQQADNGAAFADYQFR